MIDQSAIAIGPYPGFLIGCRLLRAYYKCVIDTHIILVLVVRSIQSKILVLNNPLITNILRKCSLTLTILILIWISIIFLFQFTWNHKIVIFRSKFRLNSVKICVYNAKSPNSVQNWCVPNNVIERPASPSYDCLWFDVVNKGRKHGLTLDPFSAKHLQNPPLHPPHLWKERDIML
jgi:hypothetical protein